MTASFRFDRLLHVQQAERDNRRLTLALELQHEAKVRADRNELLKERSSILEDLRSLGDGPDWTADQILRRHQRVEHVTNEIARMDGILTQIEETVRLCTAQLQEADVAVKGFEKLSDRHLTARRNRVLANDEFDRDEGWRNSRHV